MLQCGPNSTTPSTGVGDSGRLQGVLGLSELLSGAKRDKNNTTGATISGISGVLSAIRCSPSPQLTTRELHLIRRALTLLTLDLQREQVRVPGEVVPGAKRDLAPWQDDHRQLTQLKKLLEDSSSASQNPVELLREELSNAIMNDDPDLRRLILLRLPAADHRWWAQRSTPEDRTLAVLTSKYPYSEPLAAAIFLLALERERRVSGAGVNILCAARNKLPPDNPSANGDNNIKNEGLWQRFLQFIKSDFFQIPNIFLGEITFIKPREKRHD